MGRVILKKSNHKENRVVRITYGSQQKFTDSNRSINDSVTLIMDPISFNSPKEHPEETKTTLTGTHKI